MDEAAIRLTPAQARSAILAGACPEGALVEGSLFLDDESALTKLPRGLRVRGALRISGCRLFRRLPPGLSVRSLFIERCAAFVGFPDHTRSFEVPGSLHFDRCPVLQAFPERLSVGRDLTVTRCPQVWSAPAHGVPKALSVEGQAWLAECGRLTDLPRSTVVGRTLEVEDCRRFRELPNWVHAEGIAVRRCAAFEGFHPEYAAHGHRQKGDLTFEECPVLERFPRTLLVGGDFRMKGCARAWTDAGADGGSPEAMRAWRAEIQDCAGLTRLPRRMQALTELHVSGCPSLRGIGSPTEGASLWVSWLCRISNCQGLQRLESLTFEMGGELRITGCAALQAIGDGVRPGKWLSLSDCPSLSRLPARMALTERLDVHNCPSLTQEVAVEGGGRLARSGSTPGPRDAPAQAAGPGGPSP